MNGVVTVGQAQHIEIEVGREMAVETVGDTRGEVGMHRGDDVVAVPFGGAGVITLGGWIVNELFSNMARIGVSVADSEVGKERQVAGEGDVVACIDSGVPKQHLVAAVFGIVLNAILPGKDYEFED